MSKFRLPSRIARRAGAAAVACALIATGMTLTAPAAAQAAPLLEHEFTFSDPKGSDWVVPEGVTEVLVALRGGDGGCANCSQPGGRGQSYLLQLAVTPGDTLTLYAGQSGEVFRRTAGQGFVDGGKGGDKSRSGSVGNGGGGASALKLNGELLAVAGGGGGDGGHGGDRDFRPFNIDVDFGGAGGDAATGEQPGWGWGKHAGNPGKNAEDNPSFARYGKEGENGKSAGFMTSGGGGGAGGGGYPASGTAGGAGKKRLGFGAGSGGGSGMSWINSDAATLKVLETGTRPEQGFIYNGPLALDGTVKVTVPLQVDTVLDGPEAVTADQPFEVRGIARDAILGGSPVDGTYTLELDGEPIATGMTDGDITLPVGGLAEGTHALTYTFTAKHRMGVYWNDSAVTRAELTLTATPTPPAESADDYVDLPPDTQNGGTPDKDTKRKGAPDKDTKGKDTKGKGADAQDEDAQDGSDEPLSPAEKRLREANKPLTDTIEKP
ncbi:MAG: glycine-rich protein [Arthrobacter sp.]